MHDLLKNNRLMINKELYSYDLRKYFSPSCYAHSSIAISSIYKYISGKCIDIGCGDMPFKDLILKKTSHYDSVDIEKRIDDVTYIADIQDMSIINDNSYDSALCLEVLEHVPNTFKAIYEIHRILKKGGILILSVPHLSRLHEEPHDYYRFTKYGLKYLFEKYEFDIISIKPTGGIFCFLGHQLSTIFLLPIWHIPIIKKIAFWLNKWLIVKSFYAFDQMIDKNKIFALGYICVMKKK